MTNVEIRGVLYPLRFDLYTMELLENASPDGDMFQTIKNFEKKRRVRDIRLMFTAMANSARSFMGQKEDITDDVVKHCDMADLQSLTTALQEEMRRSSHAQLADGQEDGEGHRDIFMAEMEMDEKNGKAGEGQA